MVFIQLANGETIHCEHGDILTVELPDFATLQGLLTTIDDKVLLLNTTILKESGIPLEEATAILHRQELAYHIKPGQATSVEVVDHRYTIEDERLRTLPLEAYISTLNGIKSIADVYRLSSQYKYIASYKSGLHRYACRHKSHKRIGIRDFKLIEGELIDLM